MSQDGFIPLEWQEVAVSEMERRSFEIYIEDSKRRTTRHFSKREVSKNIIEKAILTAGTDLMAPIYNHGHGLQYLIRN
jgi:hypothetical protein